MAPSLQQSSRVYLQGARARGGSRPSVSAAGAMGKTYVTDYDFALRMRLTRLQHRTPGATAREGSVRKRQLRAHSINSSRREQEGRPWRRSPTDPPRRIQQRPSPSASSPKPEKRRSKKCKRRRSSMVLGVPVGVHGTAPLEAIQLRVVQRIRCRNRLPASSLPSLSPHFTLLKSIRTTQRLRRRPMQQKKLEQWERSQERVSRRRIWDQVSRGRRRRRAERVSDGHASRQRMRISMWMSIVGLESTLSSTGENNAEIPRAYATVSNRRLP